MYRLIRSARDGILLSSVNNCTEDNGDLYTALAKIYSIKYFCSTKAASINNCTEDNGDLYTALVKIYSTKYFCSTFLLIYSTKYFCSTKAAGLGEN